MSENVIELKDVVKRYGTYVATNNVSMDIAKGRIFGLLGPNGAGKTTILRMITNILIQDSGTITVLGEPVSSHQQERIGYLPEERGLYKNLKVIEQIRYFGELKGLPTAEALRRGRAWLKRLGAEEWENKKIRELSKGMSQKVQFITTVLHHPPLLILDEPFSGLDPVNADLLIEVIQELRAAGSSIILSTHVMEQVERLCDDIALVNKGRILLSGSVREVRSRYGKNTMLLEYEGSDHFVQSLTDVDVLMQSEGRVELRLKNGASQLNQVLMAAMNSVSIIRCELAEPRLHDIFVEEVQNDEQSAKEGA
jgi:ABC-2 type transport system ATP-binding protein